MLIFNVLFLLHFIETLLVTFFKMVSSFKVVALSCHILAYTTENMVSLSKVVMFNYTAPTNTASVV